MDHEPGDEYVRRIADYIRTHEAGLAAAAPIRKRRAKVAQSSDVSVFNPVGWFYPSSSSNVKPVVLAFDPHHLYYLLIRIEALGSLFASCLAAYLVYGTRARAANTGFSLNMAGMFTVDLSS